MPIIIEVFHSHAASRNMCVTHSSILQWSSGWFTYALQVWRYSSALFFAVTMLTVIWVIHFGATSSNLQVSSSHFTIDMQMAIGVVHLQTACLLVPYSYIGITTLMAVRVLTNFSFKLKIRLSTLLSPCQRSPGSSTYHLQVWVCVSAPFH
jgi:hypothetical protein